MRLLTRLYASTGSASKSNEYAVPTPEPHRPSWHNKSNAARQDTSSPGLSSPIMASKITSLAPTVMTISLAGSYDRWFSCCICWARTYRNFIKDFNTANLLLEYLVRWGTERRRLVMLRTTFDAVHLEIGGVVQVRHRLLKPEPAGEIPTGRTQRPNN